MSRRLLAGLLVASVVASTLFASPLAGVATATPGAPQFEESLATGTAGETVAVGVDVSGEASDTVQITVGNESESNFEVRATVTDADGDGSVVVRLDTGAAGNGDPASYLRVGDGDVVNETTEVAGLPDGSGGLDPADYELTLGPLDAPHDVGTLVLQAAGGDGDDGNGAAGDGDAADDAPSTPPETHDGTTLDTANGEVVLRSAPQQTVSGETTLDPGTSVSIRVQSASGKSPFLRTVETSVAEDGTFEATVDLREVRANVSVEVSVWHDSRRLAWSTGRIAACDDACPTVTPTPTGDGTRTPTPLDASEINVASVVQVERTETARIPVTFGDADALTVSVGDDDEVNYEVNATVRDANGDGRAVLLFRTAHTDDADEPALLVEERGERRPVNVTSETTLDEPVDPAPYPVDLFRGPSTDGSPETVGTIVVMEPTGDDASDGMAVGTTAGAPDAPNDASGENGANGATVAASGGDNFTTGLGALAVGGTVAVAGIALLLGVFRR